MVLLGDIFPNEKLVTNEGEFNLHDYIGDSWCIFFSHPHDFTPVCTTELARAAQLAPEFAKRNVKMIALSCNDVSMVISRNSTHFLYSPLNYKICNNQHNEWIKDIKAYGKLDEGKFPYPIIDDKSRKLAHLLGMIDPAEIDKEGMPLTARAVK